MDAFAGKKTSENLSGQGQDVWPGRNAGSQVVTVEVNRDNGYYLGLVLSEQATFPGAWPQRNAICAGTTDPPGAPILSERVQAG